MSDVPQGHSCRGLWSPLFPYRHLTLLGWVSGVEPVCLHFLLGISACLRRHPALLWRLGYVLLSCKILAEEISCVGGKPRGHRIVSVVQSQTLPWVCIMLHSYCLQSQALCFPKMSYFLFYFSRGLASNPLLSCACRELPAEASSRCVETSESRTCPWAPPHTQPLWAWTSSTGHHKGSLKTAHASYTHLSLWKDIEVRG